MSAPISVSPKEAARLLGVSRSHIYDLVNRLEIESSKTGSRILVDHASLLEYYGRLGRVS